MWQKLYAELKEQPFMIVAVAMDSRAGDPRPWVEAAQPEYVTLVDREHRLADLYQMVNVPQAVWIDEAGRIVRPPEIAGAYEGFRQMDRESRKVPADVAETVARAKATYVAAVRDWVLRGEASEHALDAEQARGLLATPPDDIARAHAAFRLGQWLLRRGSAEEGDRRLREASALHPESWCMWRQQAGVTEQGLAAQADFWQRVDALGERRYYAPVRMKGMPG